MPVSRRRNLSAPVPEYWPPRSGELALDSMGKKSWFRRVHEWVDLQFASIVMDMEEILPTAGGVVLDVGCGCQPYRHLIPEHVDYRSIDQEMADQVFRVQGHGTEYYSGDRWPVDSASADFVLCTEVLEHVFDTRTFLLEAHRALKSEGVLCLTVPFAARWHFLESDFWRFTPASLRRLLEEAGLRDVNIYARGNPLSVVCYKWISLWVPVFTRRESSSWLKRGVASLFLPTVAAASLIGQLSLRHQWGDDCLGYTVLAKKP